jgi:RHS repeat-associated protein
MLQPGRSGYATTGGWATSSTTTSGTASQLTLSSRRGNAPADYTATESIEFTTGFESGVNDLFEAYLVDGSSGSGSGGSGSVNAGGGYRYGFNGKEQDGETYGNGNEYDYGFRIYNPRIGKFLSVDPLSPEYPQLTPYQFASNRPIDGIDLDGLEFYKAADYLLDMNIIYDPKLKKITGGQINLDRGKIPPALVTYIDNMKTCSNCIGSDASEIHRFQVAFDANFGNFEGAKIEDANSKATDPDPVERPIIPQNSTQERMQRRTKRFSEPVLEGNNTKAGAAIAAIDLAGKAIKYIGDKYLQSIVDKAVVQSYNSQNIAIHILQKALDEGDIPEKYRNQLSLSQLANYLMGGSEIRNLEVVNGEWKDVANAELTKIGKKLWDSYNTELQKAKTAQENERRKAANEQKVDNTGKSNRGG